MKVDNPKLAKGAAKAPMAAYPKLAIVQMANVMACGGFKYGDFNYRESAVDAQTYIGAMDRHLLLWQDGVDLDKETRMSHLAHIMSCCAILIDAEATGMFIDNRSKTGLMEAMLDNSAQEHNRFKEEFAHLSITAQNNNRFDMDHAIETFGVTEYDLTK